MTKFDPLEEAKITDDQSEDKGLSKKKKKAAARAAKAEAAQDAPEAPPAPPAPPTQAERAARAAAKPAPVKPAPAAVLTVSPDKKYRVLEDKITSVRGRVTTLRAGKVLEARFYGGPLNLQRILDSGVKVEEC